MRKSWIEEIILKEASTETGSALRTVNIRYLRGRMLTEKGYEIRCVGVRRACRDFLEGLGLNVPFANWEILELAAKVGERGEDEEIVERYWVDAGDTLAELISLAAPSPRLYN